MATKKKGQVKKAAVPQKKTGVTPIDYKAKAMAYKGVTSVMAKKKK